jgi:hypothetical protein
MHTCFLSLGGSAASAVSASSGRGEEAASELSAVLGFVRFPRSRQGDGSPTGCCETSSRFGERWSSSARQESLTGCGEVSLSFRGRCFSRLFDRPNCWLWLRLLLAAREVWRVSWSAAQCEST